MGVRALEIRTVYVMRFFEAQRIVWEQRGLIARLRAAGFDTLDAERTLRVLEENCRIFQEHRDSLEPKEH